jgi:threonylcarbamoyladenosine tRNA methylthiotransferase MtaB
MRNFVRSLYKQNPRANIIITGCLPWKNAAELKNLPGVKGIISNRFKSGLIELLGESDLSGGSENPKDLLDILEPLTKQSLDSALSQGRDFTIENAFDYGYPLPEVRQRPSLKIQDGCDRRCTFCSVPLSRGKAISRSLKDIEKHFLYLIDQGAREIVITGVNTGAYKYEEGNRQFTIVNLLDRLLNLADKYSSKENSSAIANTGKGLVRIRLSSMEPNHISADLGKISLHKSFCNYLHIPLQSGSDSILAKMKRPYNSRQFIKNLESCLNINPDIFPGTDAMVGFPGESDDDFQSTLSILEKFSFSKIHSFRYSPRENTEAFLFKNQTDHNAVKNRMNDLKNLEIKNFSKWVSARLYNRRIAIVEKNENGIITALSDDYLEIIAEHPRHADLPEESDHSKILVKKGELYDFELTEILTDFKVKGIIKI